MLNQPTALVLGAGASCDLDFPLGPGLCAQIQLECGELAAQGGRSDLATLVHNGHLGPNVGDLIKRAAILWNGLSTAKSIDDFLHRRGDDALLVELAKTCISLVIVRAEQEVPSKFKEAWRSSPFRLEYRNRIGVQVNVRYWLATLLSHVFSRVRHKSLEDDIQAALEGLSIVTFNYDRSFEYFLIKFLQQGFSIDKSKAAHLADKHLKVFHVYGKIESELPIAQQFERVDHFTSPSNFAHVVAGAKGIRTIHEAEQVGSDLAMAKVALGRADRILFIGNSYIEQNMALLGGTVKRCGAWATAFQLSEEHRAQAEKLVAKLFRADFRSFKTDWTAEKMICDIVETL